MDFQNLMGSGDCGRVNPLAQFAQHMVEDVARQDSVGQPSTSSGLALNNFVPPQSFRMHDLMNEMKAIEPQRTFIPAKPEPQWTTEYQEPRGSRDQSLWNVGLPSQQVYLPPYPQHNFQLQSEQSGYLDNKFGRIVGSLDQLDDSYQREEPLESKVQQDTEPKPVSSQKSWKGIPIQDESLLSKWLANKTEAHTFLLCLWAYGEKCSNEEWELENPNKKYEPVFTKANLLQHREVNEYPHIKDNPVRGCDTPITIAKRQLCLDNIEDAILYADEAARQNPDDVDRWLLLYNLYQTELKNYESFFVAKQILRLDPTHTFAHTITIIAYLQVGCYYEAFETMVHWLKNHRSYGDISLNFPMVENSAGPDANARTWINSNQSIFNGVKNMLLTAARRNPTNADFTVQLFLSFIFLLTNDFDKSSDCLTTISHAKAKDLRNPESCYNAGYTLFLSGKLHEALDDLLIGLERSEHKVKLITYELIGIIHMYLTNYREAIRYFKDALDIDPSDEEFALPTRGDILKAENELCLQLYSKLYQEINPK